MQVHFSMDHLPEILYPVVTMGSFDGVHAGHRVIISRLNTLAGQIGGNSVLITFHPHPRKVLYPDSTGKELRLITSLEEKVSLLGETGLDHLLVLEFTKEFALTSSRRFVEEYLVGKLQAHTIVVGFNHFFGHNKEGNFDSLYRVRERHGFKVEEIPEQVVQDETVSSTKIRKALAEGHIQRASAYLEHFFILMAEMDFLSAESLLFNRPVYGIRISDPDKLVPPPGSYAASFHSDRGPIKALFRITSNGKFLFPLMEVDCQVGISTFIRFHKHLEAEGGDGIESEISKVEELIY